MVQCVSILGSTGSIGRQALDIVDNLNIPVAALTAGTNTERMAQQCRRYRPKLAVMATREAAQSLKQAVSDLSIRVSWGEEGLLEAATIADADCVITAVVGMVGLKPTLAAIRAGKRIGLANKETLVCAGELVMAEAKQYHTEIIPVDSEHSAIFQCLMGNHSKDEIKRIILTCSGGPFFGMDQEQLKTVTKSDALRHPNWKMGPKITVDSASLMNKGFEVIEAVRLFGVSPEQVEVLVHPQSIMHSAVEYIDNSVIAQMGAPDMRTCIQYAITYPSRKEALAKSINFAELAKLTFEKPDMNTFTLLPLAFYAIKEDGILPAVLNAADEIAVNAFLNGRIGFVDVFDVVSRVVYGFVNVKNPSLEDISNADYEARIRAQECINEI